MTQWLRCSMQSSSLRSHLLQKTQPTEAARILSYAGYSCVDPSSQAGFVFSVALYLLWLCEIVGPIWILLWIENQIFLKVSVTTVRAVNLFGQGTSEVFLDFIVLSWHQTIFRSHTTWASCGFCLFRTLQSSIGWATSLTLVVLRYHLVGLYCSGVMAVTSSWLYPRSDHLGELKL